MPRVAVRAVIIKDQRILLTRHHDAQRGDWYMVPGGGVEEGETLREAFQRELTEELDAQARFGDVLFVREIIAQRRPSPYLPKNFHQVEFFIQADLLSGPSENAPGPDRTQCGFAWIPLAALDDYLFFPASLVKNFQTQSWPDFYYGDVP